RQCVHAPVGTVWTISLTSGSPPDANMCLPVSALLAFAVATGLVLSDTHPVAAQTAAPTAPPAPTAEVKPYQVEGFRAAKFGMDEAAVKRAIAGDFSVKESSISKEVNPVDRTTVLSVTAKDVLPEIAVARL